MDTSLAKLGFAEKYFHTGDVILNYVAGPPSGPPLVFIHGQSVTWEEYTLIMPLLANRFQVYAVTLRGHGRSSWTPGSYTFNQLGHDVTRFLRDVVGRPAVVVGNSSGGVLTAWLAANAAEHVMAIVLEDPPLFRCDWPNIKSTAVYDTFLAFSRVAAAGGGGYAYFFREHLITTLAQAAGVMNDKTPPKAALAAVARLIAVKQALSPGQPIDFRFLPRHMRIMIRGTSQFDGTFSRAFVDGTVGAGFDHAETLARITQPVLFLHANFFFHEGRLMGALDDDDVARVQSLVTGPWAYIRMDCGHVIALDAPDVEAREIVAWYDRVVAGGPA
ncbi:alpha/beta hydrolase [Mycobacterium sp. RTGN5]|uniref:alpha/beta hydrolase n=1 Tax=Mycobacterium sp. RTGN5 TaxID=3016522 RepID=UPI0029C60437|nr:alpha/beta hydrolase [Mycobacterium sp. RTGN5]